MLKPLVQLLLTLAGACWLAAVVFCLVVGWGVVTPLSERFNRWRRSISRRRRWEPTCGQNLSRDLWRKISSPERSSGV